MVHWSRDNQFKFTEVLAPSLMLCEDIVVIISLYFSRRLLFVVICSYFSSFQRSSSVVPKNWVYQHIVIFSAKLSIDIIATITIGTSFEMVLKAHHTSENVLSVLKLSLHRGRLRCHIDDVKGTEASKRNLKQP